MEECLGNEFEINPYASNKTRQDTCYYFAKYDDIFVILENVPHVTDRQKRI